MASLTNQFLTAGPAGGGGGGVSGDDISTGRAYTVVFREITSAIDDAAAKNDSHSKEVIDQLRALRAQLKADAEKYSKTRLGSLPPDIHREFVDALKTIKGILEHGGGAGHAQTGHAPAPTSPATGISHSPHPRANRVDHHADKHPKSITQAAFSGGGPIGVAAMAGADALFPGAGIIVKAIQENSETIRSTYRVIRDLPKELGGGLSAIGGTVKRIHDFLNPHHPMGVISHIEKMALGGAALGIGAIGAGIAGYAGLFGPEVQDKIKGMVDAGLDELDKLVEDAAKKAKDELEKKLRELLTPNKMFGPDADKVTDVNKRTDRAHPRMRIKTGGGSGGFGSGLGTVQDLNKRLAGQHKRIGAKGPAGSSVPATSGSGALAARRTGRAGSSAAPVAPLMTPLTLGSQSTGEVFSAGPLSLREPGSFTGDPGAGVISSDQGGGGGLGLGYLGGGGLGDITPFAKGGIVDRPTVGLLGEAGPEAVVPLKDLNTGFSGGSGNRGDVVIGLMRRQTDLLGGILQALTGGKTRGIGDGGGGVGGIASGGMQLSSLASSLSTLGGLGLTPGLPGSGFGAGFPGGRGGGGPGGGFGGGGLGDGGRGRRGGRGGTSGGGTTTPGGTTPDTPGVILPMDIHGSETGDLSKPLTTLRETLSALDAGGGSSFKFDYQRQSGDTGEKVANVRYNNPGAQGINVDARAFGSTVNDTISSGKIARFDDPVHGMAANLATVSRVYAGDTVGHMISRWSNGGRNSIPGIPSNTVLTKELLNNPEFMAKLGPAIAAGEGPGHYPMSQEHIRTAAAWAIEYRRTGKVPQEAAGGKGAVTPPWMQMPAYQPPTGGGGGTPGGGTPAAPAAPVMMPSGQPYPETRMAQSGKPASYFLSHYTEDQFKGGKYQTPAQVVEGWRARGGGVGTPFIMDRAGNVFDVEKEFGYTGYKGFSSNEFKPKEGPFANLRNEDVTQMEVIARNEKDVTPGQVQSGVNFVGQRYATTPVGGHGEVNPGYDPKNRGPHRTADEGQRITQAVKAARQAGGGTIPAGGSGGTLIAFRGLRGEIDTKAVEQVAASRGQTVKYFDYTEADKAAQWVKANPGSYDVLGFSAGANHKTLDEFFSKTPRPPRLLDTVGRSKNSPAFQRPPNVGGRDDPEHSPAAIARLAAAGGQTRSLTPANAPMGGGARGTGISADQALGFWKERNQVGARLDGVRKDELHVTAEAARIFERDHPGLGVRVYGPSSGTRTSGSVANHGPGWALDMIIYDKKTGKEYANDPGGRARSSNTAASGRVPIGEAAPLYQELANNARIVNERFYPGSPIRYGGNFGGDNRGDIMHIDKRPGAPQGSQGDWEHGYSRAQMDYFGMDPSKNRGVGSLQDIQRRIALEYPQGGGVLAGPGVPTTTTDYDWSKVRTLDESLADPTMRGYIVDPTKEATRLTQATRSLTPADPNVSPLRTGIQSRTFQDVVEGKPVPLPSTGIRTTAENRPFKDFLGKTEPVTADQTSDDKVSRPPASESLKADTSDKPQHTPKHHQRHSSKTSRHVASHSHQPHNTQRHGHNRHHAVHHPAHSGRHAHHAGHFRQHQPRHHTHQPNHKTTHSHPTHHSQHPHHSQPHHVRHPNRGHTPIHHDDLNLGASHPLASAMHEDINNMRMAANEPRPERESASSAPANIHHGTPQVKDNNSDIAAVFFSGMYTG